MNAVTFHVPGKPQGKARAKTVRNKHTGKTMSYTPEGRRRLNHKRQDCSRD